MDSLRSLIASHPTLIGRSSIRDISNYLKLPTSINIHRLIDYLSQPVNHIMGEREALTVKARGTVALHASGLWVFTGSAHENGVIGNNYSLGFAIDFRDEQGNAPSSSHEKSLSGTVALTGSRDDDFAVVGYDQRIADHWDQMKTATVHFVLHASTDLAQVTLLVGESLITILAATGLIVGLVKLGPIIAPFLMPSIQYDGQSGGIGLTLGQDNSNDPPPWTWPPQR